MNSPPALLAFDGDSTLPFRIPLPLPAGTEISAARWSPSGEQLALVADGSLRVLQLGEEGYTEPSQVIADGASLPRWGRDPDSLLFVDSQQSLQQASLDKPASSARPIQLSSSPRGGGR
jgi:dipeptidyl aminopeptidase/acylaminoacyl peptidase